MYLVGEGSEHLFDSAILLGFTRGDELKFHLNPFLFAGFLKVNILICIITAQLYYLYIILRFYIWNLKLGIP